MSERAFRLTGGCQCRSVRYVIHAPAIETGHCHCSICRRLHGAIFFTYSIFPRDKFVFEQGEDNLSRYQSSEIITRLFCTTCGSHVVDLEDDGKDQIHVSTGTLDGGAHPGHSDTACRHIFVGSKVPWYEIADDLPQSDEA